MLFFLLVGLVLLPGSRRSSGNNRKGETQHKRSRCFNTTVVLQRRDVCLCAEYGYIILTTLPPKHKGRAQEFVYRNTKGNAPVVNEVIVHEGFKIVAPSDVKSLNSLTCRTVQIMSRSTEAKERRNKKKKSRRTSLPPSSRCPIIAPAGVNRISTDVHKSRRSSTKQQANQQLHTRNPRNNKELACCSFCWLD